MTWIPIDDKERPAPRDGTIIDVWLGNASADEVEFYCTPGTRRAPSWAWKKGKWRPFIASEWVQPTFAVPTHWMPVPQGPIESEACQHEWLRNVMDNCLECSACGIKAHLEHR